MKDKALFLLGCVVTLAGTMVLCAVYIGAAIYMSQRSGWLALPDKFMLALSATGGEYISLVGLIVVIWGVVWLYQGFSAISSHKD